MFPHQLLKPRLSVQMDGGHWSLELWILPMLQNGSPFSRKIASTWAELMPSPALKLHSADLHPSALQHSKPQGRPVPIIRIPAAGECVTHWQPLTNLQPGWIEKLRVTVQTNLLQGRGSCLFVCFVERQPGCVVCWMRTLWDSAMKPYGNVSLLSHACPTSLCAYAQRQRIDYIKFDFLRKTIIPLCSCCV